jgi:hypothetical protein
MIPVILILGFSFGPDTFYRGALSEEGVADNIIDENILVSLNKSFSFNGELDETESVSFDISPSNLSYIDQIALKLSWTDESDIKRFRRFENTGDTFSAKIIIDNKVVDKYRITNMPDQSGKINLRYDAAGFTNIIGCNVNVEIELVNCGDFYPVFGLGLISIEDSSNVFNLEIVVIYMVSNVSDKE